MTVSDDGIGIPPDKLKHIGQPFYQVNSDRNKPHEGSGIGLSVCTSLVDLMNGRLSIDSEPGRGTRVRVECPVRVVHNGDQDADRPAPELPQGLSVLVAEDNPVNQMLVSRMVEYLGGRVDRVKSGRAAVECIRSQYYDLVLMDINMPEMDGIEATRTVRAEHNSVPILALTAAVVNQERQTCLQAGMNGFLAKPVRLETLKAAMIDALRDAARHNTT